MKTISIIFLLAATFINPADFQSNHQESEITEIRFGTSFGMCSGYCIQEVTFKDGLVEKTLIPHREKSLEVKKCSKDYLGFADLTSKIAIEPFKELEVTIGCPDCSDAGAEWVQIFTSDGIHKKVTYDYGKEPDAIKPYIEELRKQYDQIGECE